MVTAPHPLGRPQETPLQVDTVTGVIFMGMARMAPGVAFWAFLMAIWALGITIRRGVGMWAPEGAGRSKTLAEGHGI